MSEHQQQALQFAMKLIGLRRRSVLEMRQKLQQKGYNTETCNFVIQELHNFQYLNDQQFAESYIRDRINLKPTSKKFLIFELKQKGISEHIITTTLEQLVDEQVEISMAKTLVKKKLRSFTLQSDTIKRAKLITYLMNKGFDFHIINIALQNLL